MKPIKTIIKDLEESFDLKKRFPNYFNPLLFRSATIIMFILFIIGFVTNDFKLNNVYAECNQDTPCLNPFYLCSHIKIDYTNILNNKEHTCLKENTWKTKDICSTGGCDKEYLQPHEVIGNKPNYFNKHFTLWILTLYLLTITINHILYKRRK